MQYALLFVAALASLVSTVATPAFAREGVDSIPAPTTADWSTIADLPDLSGTWSPDIRDQIEQERANPPPWKREMLSQVERLVAEEREGRPRGLFVDCLPHGLPSLMAITHDALEFLVTPGRVTVLGETDGNRLRRIWTDGRPMPEDPDPSFDGYSVGRWEQGALVVETAGILRQVYVAISEAVGVPNNGGMTVRERIHLLDNDILAVDMEVTAPAILESPWNTRRLFHRWRMRSHEIQEGVCRQGDFFENTDEFGNAVFVPAHHDGQGNVLPSPAE